jgi:hypothetical protein
MTFRSCSPFVLLLAAACGGGGGGTAVVQPTAPARLAVDGATIAATANGADLLVRLAALPSPAPALLELAIELPRELTLPVDGRLAAAVSLATLDGDFHGGRFVVLCGDAQNRDAAPLQVGPLFRLRLQPAAPRQPGTYSVRVSNRRAAGIGGEDLPIDAEAITVQVVVQ